MLSKLPRHSAAPLRKLSGLALLLPSPAAAHGFHPGTGPGEQLATGFGLTLTDPRPIVTVIAIGLALGLARSPVAARAAPWAAAGLFLGVVLAPLGPPEVVAAMLGAAAVTAASAALGLHARAVEVLATLTAALLAAASLQGFAYGELPLAYLAGIALGCFVWIALPALLAAEVARHGRIARIIVRVVTSWSAAIALILASFEMR